MSNDKKNKGDGFGRDDMMAMLGGGLSETLTRRPIPASSGSTARAATTTRDLSDMTTAETAAMLMEQQQSKKQGHHDSKKLAVGRDRHRTSKVRAYHQLLHEEAVVASTAATAVTVTLPEQHASQTTRAVDNYFENQDEFLIKPSSQSKHEQHLQPSTRAYDSSSSSSSSSSDSDADRRLPRRRVDSSSDEGDDDEVDARRKRLLEKRKGRMEVTQVPAESSEAKIIPEVDLFSKPKPARSESSSSEGEAVRTEPLPKPVAASSGSDDSSSSSGDDSSSSSSSDDDAIAAPALVTRPVFIPRHKRASVQQQEAEMDHDEKQERMQREFKQLRKQESRAMVQQVLVASAQAAPDWNDVFEGITSARNALPDDDDDKLNDGKERDEWEVRELVRLMEDWDVEQERLANQKEVARRRLLTDEEKLQEDLAAGRIKHPGEKQQAASVGQTAKRYFHRGAFYMDEDELADDDVRRKAHDYAKAATASDKVDKKALPKVMQVRKFGFANQSKYKGLAAEDTTDRKAKVLPMKRKK